MTDLQIVVLRDVARQIRQNVCGFLRAELDDARSKSRKKSKLSKDR
jgi:hypothetical protein